MTLDRHIQRLNVLHDEFVNYETEFHSLVKEKKDYLKNLLQEKAALFNWYLDHGYEFVHPDLTYTYSYGPVLGHDNNEGHIIVFDCRSKMALRYDDHTYKKIKPISLSAIIEIGQFVNAAKGIQYVDDMLEKAVQRRKAIIETHKSEFVEIKNMKQLSN